MIVTAYKQPDHLPVYLLGILSGAIFIIIALTSVKIAPDKLAGHEMSYVDFITLMLTAVTVIITVLAVFIGILAVWGYSQFQKMTEDASKNHLNSMISEGPFAKQIETTIIQHISEQLKAGDLRKLLVERVDHILLSDASLRAEKPNQNSNPDAPFKD
ncbi:hypothetical protein [Mesorhizobium sp. WSM4906]|uniref:hypothetical protein n=1 Tax=Mesorhizobium sp. WSM4906 TaxID=3038546 RepID=UPI0024166335|nr:hypothetical protein [Mesorhizobium sp. WSM4906]WFP73386.1 hypothetical protein QAZ22_16550 [Mesorhizobium sp. WSM4906]